MENNNNSNNAEKKMPTPMEAILVIVLGYFLFFFLTVLMTMFFSPQVDPASLSPMSQKWLLLFGEMSLAVLPYFYLKKKQFPIFEMIRWRSIPSNIVWASVLIALSFTVLSDEIDRLIQIFFPQSEEASAAIKQIMTANSAGELLLLVLSAVVVAALVEEALFRGFLQRVLEEHINVTRAVIYGSLAWTMFHLTPYSFSQAIPIFLLGFIYGYLSWRTKSIVPGIICHGINNGLALLYYNMNFEEGIPVYEWGGHVSPLFLLPAAVIAYKGIQYIDEIYRRETFSSSSTMNSSD